MKKLLILPTLLYLLTACEDVVKVDIPFRGQEIFIEGRITDQLDTCKLRIGKLNAFFNNSDFLPVSNAKAFLLEESKYIDTLQYDSKSQQYLSSKKVKGEQGKTYSVEIHYGDQVFRATDQMIVGQHVLDTIRLIYRPEPIDEVELQIRTKDLNIGRNNYYWRSFHNGERTERFNLLFDRYLEGSDSIKVNVFEESDLYPNNEEELKKSDEYLIAKYGLKVDDELVVEQMLISRLMFDFLQSIQFQRRNSQGSQFGTPPAALNSNVFPYVNGEELKNEDKAHGVFYCARLLRDTLVITEGFRDRIPTER